MKKLTFLFVVLILSISVSAEPGQKRQHKTDKSRQLAELFTDQEQANDIQRALKTSKWMQARQSGVKSNYTHKLDSVLYQVMDQNSETLRDEYLDVFLYDEAWRPSVIIEKEWDILEEKWFIWGQTDFAYNDNGLVNEMVIYYAEDAESPLLEESKLEAYYGEGNTMDSIYMYDAGISKAWELVGKQYFFYNDSDQLIQSEIWAFDEEEEMWLMSGKMQYTYDAEGRRESMGMYIPGMDFSKEEDLLISLTEYFYNKFGQLSRTEISAMNWMTFILEPSDKTEYAYDGDGDLLTSTDYYWEDEQWEPDYRDNYFYFDNLNFNQVAFPFTAYAFIYATMDELMGEFNKAPKEYLGYEYIDGDFEFTDKEILYYSPTSASADEYTLTYLAGENGEVIGETTQTVTQGGSGSEVEAIPDDGYHFTEWSDGETASKRTDNNVTSDITVTAFFALNTYTITATPNNETYGSVTGADAYAHGEEVTLTATPNDGYHFVHWTENGDVVSTDNVFVFTAIENRELIAVFEFNTYTITATPNNETYGSVTGADAYAHGEEVTLTATPNDGYHFVHWTENGDVVSTDNVFVFSAIENRELIAVFDVNTYTITATANNESFGSVTGDGEYTHGQSATLVATSNNADAYVFINWTENDLVVHDEAAYTFTVTENRTLAANFQNVTSVNEASQKPSINTYPNPATHSVMIESPVIVKNITVYDTSGRHLMFVVVNDKRYELNTSSLKTGAYILQATTTEGSVTSRFLIE